MGRSGLNENGSELNNIDALLGKSKVSVSSHVTKAVKLSEKQIEHVNAVSKMLGTTNFSEGLRHCIDNYWDEHSDEILRICKKRDAIKPL